MTRFCWIFWSIIQYRWSVFIPSRNRRTHWLVTLNSASLIFGSFMISIYTAPGIQSPWNESWSRLNGFLRLWTLVYSNLCKVNYAKHKSPQPLRKSNHRDFVLALLNGLDDALGTNTYCERNCRLCLLAPPNQSYSVSSTRYWLKFTGIILNFEVRKIVLAWLMTSWKMSSISMTSVFKTLLNNSVAIPFFLKKTYFFQLH